jgi:hypothetical protein
LNLAEFSLSRVHVPAAAYRNGYVRYIASAPPAINDFAAYEAVRRHLRGWHLVGYDRQSIAFGDYAFHGPIRQSIAPYDPNLTEGETRTLIERVVIRRANSETVPAFVLVAPEPSVEPQIAIVLRGRDDERLFVPRTMAPSRYWSIADDR